MQLASLVADSESEGEEGEIFIPTVEGAKTFFSKKKEAVAGEGGEGSEVTSGGQQVMRDRKMLELARKQRERRCMKSRAQRAAAGRELTSSTFSSVAAVFLARRGAAY